VNIGSRQDGRLRGTNVLDVDYDSDAITHAVEQCLFDDVHRDACRNTPNPYYRGGAGVKIAQVLADVTLDQKLLRKRMMLRGEVRNGWYR
jgi:UDP-N-acetylglucosamine 2-epimerase